MEHGSALLKEILNSECEKARNETGCFMDKDLCAVLIHICRFKKNFLVYFLVFYFASFCFGLQRQINC